MSPVYIANTNNKIYPQLDSSSMPAIALNNTQIRTFINIFPPNGTSLPPPISQNLTMNPIDLRKHNPSTIAAHALYHFYFPHLFALQNQQQTHQLNDLGIKRSAISDGKLNISIVYYLSISFKESLSTHKRKSNVSQKRFDFAKLADEAVKDKEEIFHSPISLDASSNKIDLSISSTPSPLPAPAAITSGVSLLASNPTSYVRSLFVYLFICLDFWGKD
jgi:hypothetical protein